MSEAFEILSSAINEAIEEAKNKTNKLERREVELEIPKITKEVAAAKSLRRKKLQAAS